LTLSGEAKTGILWEEGQDAGKEKDLSKVRMHSKDDAGGSEGRFRLNMDYINANNFGFKVRIEWNNWTDSTPEKWSYAFGYGNFFDDQLTISAGKLGSSPWGTGGPEMWKELEVARSGGVRVEYKPNFIPEHLGTVNVGFVLNDFDDPNEASITREATFTDILMESVLGISYTHSLFHVRLAYRLDSERDSKQRMDGEKEGGKMIYRAEDRVLTNYLPGFQVWALGYLEGVGIGVHDMFYNFQNWFFAEYSPPLLGNLSTPFTAQIRFGYDYVESRQIFHIRPSFYWHFFDKLISAGASFWYGQDYGNKMFPGSPYFYMEFEPKVQLNLSSSYVAFVYSMRRQYKGDYAERGNSDPVRQTQFINLRFCIYF
jgi:hypothetical protein